MLTRGGQGRKAREIAEAGCLLIWLLATGGALLLGLICVEGKP